MAGNKQDERSDHDVHLPDLERPGMGHESADVDAWAVGKFGIALVLLCGVSLLLLTGLFKYFISESGGPPQPVNAGVDARRLPPQPRLQETPTLDLKQMRAAEDEILNGYGWVDQQKGLVRIPISVAIELLAQRGLPARAPAPAAANSDVSEPTESGLGPKAQQPGGPLAGELQKQNANDNHQ